MLSLYRSLTYIFIVLLVFFVTFKLFSFELWNQVYDLKGTDISDMTLAHPHFLRYALILPVFILSDYIDATPDFVFSYVCVILLFFTASNMDKIYSYYRCGDTRRTTSALLFFMMIITFLSMFINGRGLFPFAGFTYIVSNVIAWEFYDRSSLSLFCKNAVGHFFCSVSTGTFLVSIIFIVLWLIMDCRRRRGFRIYLSYLVSLMLLSPVIYLFVMKNVDFFGGGLDGLYNMLDHGFGAIFKNIDESVLVVAIPFLLLLIFFAVIFLVKYKKIKVLIISVYCSLFGGLFGFTTLSIGLPLLFVLFFYFNRQFYASLSKKFSGRMIKENYI